MTDVFDRLAGRICDGHVHVGNHRNLGRFHPAVVARDLEALGLSRIVASSTSGAQDQWDEADAELQALANLMPGRVIPLLWVSPGLVANGGLDRLPAFYRGFKVHPFSHAWHPDHPDLIRVFESARVRRWPVLVHTGWTPESHAGRFANLYGTFPEVTVVLAHGRPLDETIDLVRGCGRIFADTAYMSLDQVRSFVDACGHDRLVHGSDFPVDRHYFPRASATVRYRRRVEGLVRCFGETAVLRWADDNFHAVFGH